MGSCCDHVGLLQHVDLGLQDLRLGVHALHLQELDDDDGFRIVMDDPYANAGSGDEALDGDDDFHIVLDGHTASGNPYLPAPGSYGGMPQAGAAVPGGGGGAAPMGPRGLSYT